MICPFCLHTKTHIYNSRATAKLNVTWRRRRCLKCSKPFSTRETVDLSNLLSVVPKKDATIRPFSYLKLLSSIARALDHLPETIDEKAHWLAQTVQRKLLENAAQESQKIHIEQIAEYTAAALRHYDYPAYVKYASSHGLKITGRRQPTS